MLKVYKKIISLLMCVCLTFLLTACSGNIVWVNKKFDTKAITDKLPNNSVIAQNNSYQLVWDSVSCSVTLIEKATQNRWGTTPITEGEPQFNELGMPIKKDPQLESALIVKYINPETNLEEQTLSVNSAVKNGRIIAKAIKNGINVEYYFDDVDIMIPVDYVLREDSVEVSVNTENIQEDTNKVVSIAVCPFWCSAQNDKADSYIFYPSGSGTLIDNKTVSQTGVTYSAQVYGEDPVITLDDLISTQQEIRLPVYGAKDGDLASFAIIEESAESAIISAKVGSKATKHSGVYSEFLLRGYCPNMVDLVQGTDKEFNIYSQSMIKSVIKVGFYPLAGEKANYSGMASVYRNYLKKNGFLSSKSEENFLNVTLLGGTMVDKSFIGIPYKDLMPSTTLAQAKDILKEIENNTKASFNARLLGYGSNGLENTNFAGKYSINKNLGSVSELNELSKYCKQNNIELYFDFDLLKLKNSSCGYSRFFDVAYNSLNKIADIYEYDVVTRSRIEESSYNLLSRELLDEAYNKAQNKISKWEIEGLSFSSLSSVAYSDYSVDGTVKYYSKGNMGKDVQKIFNSAHKKYKIAGDDANAYAAVLSDVIYNTPTYSSKEQIFENDVPFYQMVFKGYLDLAGEEINAATDSKTAFLKSVESGCGLNYLLISSYHNDFINYNGYDFFGSLYKDVKNRLFNDYSSTKDYYSNIAGAEIVKHEILSNGLRVTTFDNGVKVYVNYTEQEKMSPLGNVDANNFLWGRVE